MKNLKSVSWLKKHLKDSDLILLDASQVSNISGAVSNLVGTNIPGSQYFDIKNVFSDGSSRFPNTVPSANQFQQEVQKLGINSNSTVVVYDNIGIYTSPRVWWLFRYFGHSKVYVLDGGLPEWVANDNETSAVLKTTEPGDFKSVINLKLIKTIEDIQKNIDSGDFDVVDARNEARFNSTTSEPRKGLRSGNIPNSSNIPYSEVLHLGKIKSTVELTAIFSKTIETKKSVSFSCGSGVTACILLLAHQEITDDIASIYDGSWTEWGTSID